MATTKTQPSERARNLLLMGTPALWPAWPFLPLVRRRVGEDLQCGLLYDVFGLNGRTGFSATVFVCNLFLMPQEEKEFLNLPREVFDGVEEIFAAGWRVD